jgi:hypothetical protein
LARRPSGVQPPPAGSSREEPPADADDGRSNNNHPRTRRGLAQMEQSSASLTALLERAGEALEEKEWPALETALDDAHSLLEPLMLSLAADGPDDATLRAKDQV